jgi:DNA-directed RNA polymerase sigma subunit (sigma70/sigma32)
VKLSRFIHIPEHHFSCWSRLSAAENPDGHIPATEEVSRQLGMRDAQLQRLRRSRETTAVHLEDLSDPERGKHWSESVADSSARVPAREAESRDLREFLDRELCALPERTQQMLRMAHFTDDPQPFAVLAKTFGVSKERCRQVCRQGLGALRRRIEGRMRSVLGIDSAAAFDSGGERRTAEVVYRVICTPEPAVAFTADIETSAA